ncbi:putative RNA-dependent RNA polymerase [Alternaria alternata fusarivirus 1]|nr:putative RNA-dependent RNA polymerase [Alternaria alternata fusarivirus 1]
MATIASRFRDLVTNQLRMTTSVVCLILFVMVNLTMITVTSLMLMEIVPSLLLWVALSTNYKVLFKIPLVLGALWFSARPATALVQKLGDVLFYTLGDILLGTEGPYGRSSVSDGLVSITYLIKLVSLGPTKAPDTLEGQQWLAFQMEGEIQGWIYGAQSWWGHRRDTIEFKWLVRRIMTLGMLWTCCWLVPLRLMRAFRIALILVGSFFLVNPQWDILLLYSVRLWARALYGAYLLIWNTRYFMALTRSGLKVLRNALLIDALAFAQEISFLENKYGARAAEPRKFKAIYTDVSLKVISKVNALNLPSFAKSISDTGKVPSIAETLEVLKEVGYPVDESVTIEEPVSPEKKANESWGDWLHAVTSWSFGLHPLRTYHAFEFDKFRAMAPVFKRSDEYVTLDNELEATSRYFRNTEVSISDFERGVDATWSLLWPIFKESKITPLWLIYRNWEKKYNLGVFATSPKSKRGLRKMRRREDLFRFPSVREYLKYWERLVENFPRMAMISNVFYKTEALPERKWGKGKVRTPVSSMLPQYLSQMIFSFQPNHNFRPFDTPVKVGLPLNGSNLGEIFRRHSRFSRHHMGDMSDFDSSITGEVQKAVKAIRKRGFRDHSDFPRICELIDMHYSRIEKSKLLLSSTGKVYNKGQGLTTGHGSTTSDNSIVTTFLYMMAWSKLTGLSAHDFRRFNELSVYGDDHALSISDMAPAVWTFANASNIMKEWGIDMREEKVSAGLQTGVRFNELTFLSKTGRVATEADKAHWRFTFGTDNCPAIIVTHDKQSLLGKMMARTTSKDPAFKIKRIISYMSLTAHHPEAYQIAREAIHNIVKRYPDLENRWAQVPSYKKVLSDWYSNLRDVREPEDESTDQPLVSYGELTTLDYITNTLSVVPDLLNPKVYNAGFALAVQNVAGDALQWPVELIQRANKVTGKGHLDRLVDVSPYRFLARRELVTPTENMVTLQLRNWLFILLRGSSTAFFVKAWADWAFLKIASAQFLLNGVVMKELPTFDIPIRKILLTVALSWVRVPQSEETDAFGGILASFSLPDPGKWSRKLTGLLSNAVWSRQPPNFKNLEYIRNQEMMGKTHLVTAGTGTGKSTTMILYLHQTVGHNFEKIIVIEPRSLVVKGLVKYTSTTLGMDVSGSTTGLTLDQRAKVWYVTPQELFLHEDWISDKHLFVLDECHVDEPFYKFALAALKMAKASIILATATPSDRNIELADFQANLDLPNIWKVEEERKELGKFQESSYLARYFGAVNEYIDMSHPSARFLIFVNDLKNIDYFVHRLPGKCVAISSKEEYKEDASAKFYITTAVADVAITVPDIDVVITANVVRGVTLEKDGSTRPIFNALSPSRLKQRRGRTGRTNNGTFVLMSFDLGSDVQIEKEHSAPELITSWLDMGLDLTKLYDIYPRPFEELMSELRMKDKSFTNQVISILNDRIKSTDFRNFSERHNFEYSMDDMDKFGVLNQGRTGRGTFHTLQLERAVPGGIHALLEEVLIDLRLLQDPVEETPQVAPKPKKKGVRFG